MTPDDPSAPPEDSRSGHQPRRSAGFRTALLVVLLVALVASAAGIAYGVTSRPVPKLGIEGSQDRLQAQRERVMAQAEQFMLRINTYGPQQLQNGQMPEYRKLVEEVITPKFAVDFDKNVPAAEATVSQAGVARSAKVYSTGVASIDSDSATALVAGEFTQSYPQSAGSTKRVYTEPAQFRVTVQLVKINGTWLVDDFSPVTGDDDTSGGASGSAQPSPSASTGSGQGGGTGQGGTTGQGGGGGRSGSGSASPSEGASR